MHPVHGLLFSALEIIWLMGLFWPVKTLLHIPLKFAFLWLYSPILVIFCRAKKDRHNLPGELFIRYVWDPPLLLTIYVVGLTRLGGDRFLFPFCTVLDDQIGPCGVRRAEVVEPHPRGDGVINRHDFFPFFFTVSVSNFPFQPWAHCRYPGTSRRW